MHIPPTWETLDDKQVCSDIGQRDGPRRLRGVPTSPQVLRHGGPLILRLTAGPGPAHALGAIIDASGTVVSGMRCPRVGHGGVIRRPGYLPEHCHLPLPKGDGLMTTCRADRGCAVGDRADQADGTHSRPPDPQGADGSPERRFGQLTPPRSAAPHRRNSSYIVCVPYQVSLRRIWHRRPVRPTWPVEG
jgi:hypothetical protein